MKNYYYLMVVTQIPPNILSLIHKLIQEKVRKKKYLYENRYDLAPVIAHNT